VNRPLFVLAKGPVERARNRKLVDDQALSLTEAINPSNSDLDLLDTRDLLHRINDEDRRAAWAVEREIDVIATAVDAISERLRTAGQLHYFGAGTSGRIAVLDAAEIPPTFSEPHTVVAHIAGGSAAMTQSVEEAEDDEGAGRFEVRAANIGRADAVVGLSASGSAAFVLGAIQAAGAAGALTIGITNNPGSALERLAQIPIVLRTGPEVVAGSTRMKAGAAQKMALTMMSTAVMVKLGKVHGNLMVDLRATNSKLRARARRLTMHLANVDEAAAQSALEQSGHRIKIAVAMLRRGCNVKEAERALEQSHGSLRALLKST
jgi:N-acetylmuramic acid 6-phosphate etherase